MAERKRQGLRVLIKRLIEAWDPPDDTYGLRSDGAWRSPLFDFVLPIKRYLPEATTPDDAWKRVDRIMQTIDGGWRAVTHLHGDEVYTEFNHCWDSIRHDKSDDLLASSLARAERQPLELPEDDPHAMCSGYRRFVSLCAWMAVTMHPKPIALPQRQVAEVLGHGRPNTIGIWIQWAINSDYMELVEKHQFSPRVNRGRAAKYHFRIERWQVLATAAGVTYED